MRERGACTESHTCACASVDVFAVLFVMMSQRVKQSVTVEQLYGQTMDALFVASNLRR